MTVPATSTPSSPTDPLADEIDAERHHLAASRDALARMRDRARHLFQTGATVAGDAYSAETLGRTLARRIAELSDDPRTPPFFGRLTFAVAAPTAELPAEPGADHSGHSYHIGRRHVTDEAGEPMVLDWRAPVSRAFYQASAVNPQGIAVRRRFGFAGGALTGFEDEHLDRGEELGTGSRILTEEIERPRIGPMRDIVATIQPEQDELVRADLGDTICVQGGPGTGKTAVGLHRAAYLLYQHRERLRRTGVLVVGPNRAFLHYISAVLPALGEIDVDHTRIDDLVTPVPIRGSDSPDVASLKHDARLATVLARALAGRISRPIEGLVVSDGAWRWRISVEALRRIVDDVRRERPAYAVGRERVRARAVALLQRQSEARRGESPPESWLRRMARQADVRAFLDRVWPEVTAQQVVFDLLTDPAMLAGAADGVLTAHEQNLLLWRPPPRTVKSARWSPADAVLIDEAAGLVNRLPSYGHIVVDEAQDLSPMQCRAIARRSGHGSLTVLGDLAQGTAGWAARDWDESLRHLGKAGAPVIPLTTGFRVPAAVIALANRLLPALDAGVPEAVSLRRDGLLRIERVADPIAAAVAEVGAALAREGSIGVICCDRRVSELTAALARAGTAAVTPEAETADTQTADTETPDTETPDTGRVSVLPASVVKGLEFDHVIVVEPAEIVAAERRGLNRLYVVLTRAVSRLVVLHNGPLPGSLDAEG